MDLLKSNHTNMHNNFEQNSSLEHLMPAYHYRNERHLFHFFMCVLTVNEAFCKEKSSRAKVLNASHGLEANRFVCRFYLLQIHYS